MLDLDLFSASVGPVIDNPELNCIQVGRYLILCHCPSPSPSWIIWSFSVAQCIYCWPCASSVFHYKYVKSSYYFSVMILWLSRLASTRTDQCLLAMGMVGEACLPCNAYYPRTPDYTLCSGVHVCWSEHSDSSFVYGFMILDYGFGTMTATTSI